MADTSKNLKENRPPIYHRSPLTLQELASMRIALSIWLENFRNGCPTPNTFTFETKNLRSGILDSHKLVNYLPYKFIKMIDSHIYPITKKIEYWYLGWVKILQLDHINNFNRFDLVVFGGKGTLHVQDTIANFLEDGFLCDRTKFEIACRRCMEEKVDFFWPLVSEKFNIECMQFKRDPVLYYWICRKRGELNRIPLEDFDCIEHLMISQCCNLNYRAVEYFLEILNPRDQLDQIDVMLQYSEGFECVEDILPRLGAHMQHYVLGKKAKTFSTNFIERYPSIEYTVQTWLYIRNFFTPERFYEEVVKYLTGSYFYSSVAALNFQAIWSHTPFHLKEYTLKHHLTNVLDRLLSKYSFSSSTRSKGIGVMLAIISDVDVPARNLYWEENWRSLFRFVKPSEFNDLLATCIVKPEAIFNFKQSLLGTDIFREYCSNLMKSECYVELEDILNNLSSEQGQIFEFKKQLLGSNYVDFSGLNERRIERYSRYIDTVFSGDETLSREFKESRLLSSAAWSSFIQSFQTATDLSYVKPVISSLVSSNRQTECKSELLTVLRNALIDGRLFYHFESLSQFLSWCMDDDAGRVDDFLASLPIHDIFEAWFSNDLRSRDEVFYQNRTSPIFGSRGSRINEFLKWYFKSKVLFENFKREKIEYYERMDETEVSNKFGLAKRLVIEVLREGFLMAEDEIVDRVWE